jgi:hypothetical protein
MVIKLVSNFFNEVFSSLGGCETIRCNKGGDRLIDNALLLSKVAKATATRSVKMGNVGKQARNGTTET